LKPGFVGGDTNKRAEKHKLQQTCVNIRTALPTQTRWQRQLFCRSGQGAAAKNYSVQREQPLIAALSLLFKK
jgi:hypothetical protein